MKQFALRIGGVILLLLIICLTLKISLRALISPSYLVLVLLGAILLGVTSIQKPAAFCEYLDAVGKQGLSASCMISFLALFVCFSESIDYENVRAQTMECMLPVLYGFILRIIMNGWKMNVVKEDVVKREEVVKEEKEKNSGTIQEILKEKGLTKRECEVAVLLLENRSNQEIAGELFLTENTVKKHNANIYKKMNVANREQLKNLDFTRDMMDEKNKEI